MELPVTAFLRTLMAKHRARIIQSLRTRVEQVMFQHCTHTGSRSFRTQRQTVAVQLIRKRIHLFLDDVRYRTNDLTNKSVCSTIGMRMFR